jgi:hypothetical protein
MIESILRKGFLPESTGRGRVATHGNVEVAAHRTGWGSPPAGFA